MTETIVIAVIAGLCGMFGWGFADFFAKKTIDQIGDIASLLWAHTLASTLLILYIFSEIVSHGTRNTLPMNYNEWIQIAYFGVLQALVYIFVYRAFSKGKVSLLSPIFSSYAGLVALVSIVIFRESVSAGTAIALSAVFIGILITSLDPAGLKIKILRSAKHPGLFEILISVVLATIWTLYWANFVSGKDWKIYAALMYIFMTVTIFIYSLVGSKQLNVTDKGLWKYLFGIGLGEIIAYVGITYGFSETQHTSIVALLSGAFALPVIILSYVFLKERISLLHRIGTLVIIAGIAIISLT